MTEQTATVKYDITYAKDYIDLCIKYDEMVDPDKGIDYTKYGSIGLKIKKYVSENRPIPLVLIQKYNICMIIRDIIGTAKVNEDKMNTYTKSQYSALRNGKTLRYYMKHPTDLAFIDSLRETMKLI